MLLQFLRRGLRPRVPADDRRERLRKVLDRAGVSYSASTPEHALDRVPACLPPRRPSAAGAPQRLRFPLVIPARVAMFAEGFLPDGAMRRFEPGQSHLLEKYVPEAIVAPLQLALTLADQKHRRLLAVPGLNTAVVVLTSLGDEPLAGHHKDLLWMAFGVPVFEQLQSWDGTVIGRECEVHDGLHIDDSSAVLQCSDGELIVTELTPGAEPVLRGRTGLAAEIVTEHCECGAETPRLKNLASLHAKGRPKVRMAVAS